MTGGMIYYIVLSIVRFFLFFWHPVLRVKGRENIPKDGRLMICANHRGAADPIWIVLAMRTDHVPRIMAKKEIMQVPVLGWFLRKFGVFGVDRDNVDVNAIKTGLRCLSQDQQLLVFPEGTRLKPGQRIEPKRGAVTMAARTNTPILPVYISTKRYPFSPITCIFGEPYHLQVEGKRATDEQLQQFSQELMNRIYQLGEGV